MQLYDQRPLRLYNLTSGEAPQNVKIQFDEGGLSVLLDGFGNDTIQVWPWASLTSITVVEHAAYRPTHLHFKSSEPPLQHVQFEVLGCGKFNIDCMDAKDMYQLFADQYLKHSAAIKIGAVSRGKLERKTIDERHNAAAKIEALHRGKSARSAMEERQAAAAKIEALQRGKAAREVIVPMLEQRKDAASKIAAIHRGNAVRAEPVHVRKSAKPLRKKGHSPANKSPIYSAVPLRLYDPRSDLPPPEICFHFSENGLCVMTPDRGEELFMWRWPSIKDVKACIIAHYRPDYPQFKAAGEPPLQRVTFQILGCGSFDVDCKNASELQNRFAEEYKRYALQSAKEGSRRSSEIAAESEKMTSAAVKIEARYRSHAAQGYVSQKRKELELQQNEHNPKISTSVERDGTDRKLACEDFQRRNTAATKLQAVQRGKQARTSATLQDKHMAALAPQLADELEGAQSALQYAISTREQVEAEMFKQQREYESQIRNLTRQLDVQQKEHADQIQQLTVLQKEQEMNMLHKVRLQHDSEVAQLKAQQLQDKEAHSRAIQDHELRLARHIQALKHAGAESSGVQSQISALEAAHAEQLEELKEKRREELHSVRMACEQDLQSAKTEFEDRIQRETLQEQVAAEQRIQEVRAELEEKYSKQILDSHVMNQPPVDRVIHAVVGMSTWEHVHLLEKVELWKPLANWEHMNMLMKFVAETKLAVFRDTLHEVAEETEHETTTERHSYVTPAKAAVSGDRIKKKKNKAAIENLPKAAVSTSGRKKSVGAIKAIPKAAKGSGKKKRGTGDPLSTLDEEGGEEQGPEVDDHNAQQQPQSESTNSLGLFARSERSFSHLPGSSDDSVNTTLPSATQRHQYEAKKLMLLKASRLRQDAAHSTRKTAYLVQEIKHIQDQIEKVEKTRPPSFTNQKWEADFVAPLRLQISQLRDEHREATEESNTRLARLNALRPECNKSVKAILSYAVQDFSSGTAHLKEQLEPVFACVRELAAFGVGDLVTLGNGTGASPGGTDKPMSVAARKNQAKMQSKNSRSSATAVVATNAVNPELTAQLKELDTLKGDAAGTYEQLGALHQDACAVLHAYHAQRDGAGSGGAVANSTPGGGLVASGKDGTYFL